MSQRKYPLFVLFFLFFNSCNIDPEVIITTTTTTTTLFVVSTTTTTTTTTTLPDGAAYIYFDAISTLTNVSNVTVSGTTAIDSYYEVALVQYSLNDAAWKDAAGTEEWSFNEMLTNGTNSIIIRAIADSLEVSYASFKIAYDKKRPGIVIQSPTSSPYTEYNLSQWFKAYAYDTFPHISAAEIGFSVNGVEMPLGTRLSGSTNYYSNNMVFPKFVSTTNYWTNTLQDVFGNVTNRSGIVIRNGLRTTNGGYGGIYYGSSVALSTNGKIIAVGTGGSGNGYVNYLYNFNESVWSKYTLAGSTSTEGFGMSVAINAAGNWIAIGAPLRDYSGVDTGIVYVYIWNGSSFSSSSLGYGYSSYSEYGRSVSISDNGYVVAAGVPGYDSYKGAFCIWIYSGSFSRTAHVINSIGNAAMDYFGCSVALTSSGKALVVGSYQSDIGGTNNCGAVCFYTNTNSSGSIWIKMYTFTASDKALNDYYGKVVDVSADGNTVVIGAPYDDNIASNGGSVYVYTYSGGTWSETKLYPSDVGSEDHFGSSVSVSGDGTAIVIGSKNDDDGNTESGTVYVYTYSAGTWSYIKLHSNDYASTGYLGTAVDISRYGEYVTATCPGDASGFGRLYHWR